MLRKFFKTNKFERKCYAITQGIHKGEFYVYISHDENNFYFLSLPQTKPVEIPATVFRQGIKSKIVDLIETLPHNVYELCIAQYNEAKTKDNIDRLKQSAASSGVDS